MVLELNAEQKKKFEAVFAHVDSNHDGKITIEELGRAFEQIGRTATEGELLQLQQSLQCDEVDRQTFLTIVTQKLQDPDSYDEVRQAFQVLFENQPNVRADELKRVLMEFGERLSEAEATELIADIGPDANGLINVASFLDRVYEIK